MLRVATFLMFGIVMWAVYFYYVRSWLRSQSPWMAAQYDRLDSFYSRILMLAQKTWVSTSIMLMAALPDIAQFLTEIGLIDWSQWLPSHAATRFSQIIMFAGIIVRFLIARSKSTEPPKP